MREGRQRAGIGFASRSDYAPEQVLFPDERALIPAASVKRRQEFATGRHCARLAMQNLGMAPVAILTDTNGAPCWPSGIVGSISHTHGLTVASVAHAGAVKGLGVDVEYRRGPFPTDVFEMVATTPERQRLGMFPPATADAMRYALFSAKESVFKYFYGAFREQPALARIDISIDAALNSFNAQWLDRPELGLAKGRIGFSSDHVITTAWQPAEQF